MHPLSGPQSDSISSPETYGAHKCSCFFLFWGVAQHSIRATPVTSHHLLRLSRNDRHEIRDLMAGEVTVVTSAGLSERQGKSERAQRLNDMT